MARMSIMTKANKAAKRLGVSSSQITHVHDLSEVSSEGAKGIMIVFQVADEKYAAIVSDNGHIKKWIVGERHDKVVNMSAKTKKSMRLNNNQYIIFLLYAYGFTQKAIARLMDCSSEPINRRIANIRLMLEAASVGDELEEEDESDGNVT